MILKYVEYTLKLTLGYKDLILILRYISCYFSLASFNKNDVRRNVFVILNEALT